MQCIFVYLPWCIRNTQRLYLPVMTLLGHSSPLRQVSSLFNDQRNTYSQKLVMFSHPMYVGMGIGPACSLLGALTAACIAGIFVLYFYGHKLRARSRFSAK